MKAKKVICIILTFILAFTLLSGPWRAEVEAAGPAIAVAVVAIVGFFIVTAGYTFDSQADFRSVTDAFMESDAAEYVTKINDIVTSVATAGISLANFNLARIISQPWFLEFWQAILEFFDRGEVSVQTTVSVPSGYALYNGVKLPVVYQYSDSNQQAQCIYHAILHFPSTSSLNYNRYVYLCTKGIFTFNNAGTPASSLMKGFVYGRCDLGDSSWTGLYSSISGGCLGGETSVKVIWSNFNLNL